MIGRLDDISQSRLIDWYNREHRDLPWRRTRDPYHILVSEIMLQQTQADRVIPKYCAFLEKFPTIQSLADAPAAEVIRAWSGLGYNRRALNLQRTCREVIERYGGKMPADPDVLVRLPGIGPYTAGAIACFAFETDVGFVDTNIRRVLHRVLAGPEMPEPRVSDREIEDVARALVPAGRGYSWNQALMELGATMCRARSVQCEECPLQNVCAARLVIGDVLAATRRGDTKAQPRFETTSRYYRGRIVEALRNSPNGLTLEEIGRLFHSDFGPNDIGRVSHHVTGLVRDGLIVQQAPLLSEIHEETVPYDSGTRDLGTRFHLPE